MALTVALGINPGFPALTRVVVAILFDRADYSTIMNDVKGELAELDRLFASTSKFPRLHAVTIKLKVYSKSLMGAVSRFWIGDPGNIETYLPLVAARSDCTLIPLVRSSL
jgi:hypothetical protein